MINYVTVPILPPGSASTLGTVGAGTTLIYVMPIPGDNVGGGVTIKSFHAFSGGTIPAASAPIFDLVTLSAAGAYVGTVSTTGSAAFSPGVARSGTMTAANVWADQDSGAYHLAVRWAQTEELGLGTSPVQVSIAYVQGR